MNKLLLFAITRMRETFYEGVHKRNVEHMWIQIHNNVPGIKALLDSRDRPIISRMSTAVYEA
jgi:hypothetical protein